jgi:hypothetical protein
VTSQSSSTLRVPVLLTASVDRTQVSHWVHLHPTCDHTHEPRPACGLGSPDWHTRIPALAASPWLPGSRGYPLHCPQGVDCDALVRVPSLLLPRAWARIQNSSPTRFEPFRRFLEAGAMLGLLDAGLVGLYDPLASGSCWAWGSIGRKVAPQPRNIRHMGQLNQCSEQASVRQVALSSLLPK